MINEHDWNGSYIGNCTLEDIGLSYDCEDNKLIGEKLFKHLMKGVAGW